MNTPTDALLDGLVARLSEKTGHQWQRRDAWDVTVTIMLGGRPRGYLHATMLRPLDSDPAGYADMVFRDFEKHKAKYSGMEQR